MYNKIKTDAFGNPMQPKLHTEQSFKEYLRDEVGIDYKFTKVDLEDSKWHSCYEEKRKVWHVQVELVARVGSGHLPEKFSTYFGTGYETISIEDVLLILVREYKDIMEMSAVDLLENEWGYDLFDMVQNCREMLANAKRLQRAIGIENVSKLFGYFEDKGEW